MSYSVEDSEKTRMINTIDESIDTVLDSLDFNMNIHRSRSNSSQDLRLNLDVAELKQHPLSGIFLNIEEDYNEDTKENETHVSGDMASLLHLALYELQKLIEDSMESSINLRNMNVKGANSMARTPYEMMKILILNNNYDREDIEYKASKYLKGNRITQAEYDELISLMDANEIVK